MLQLICDDFTWQRPRSRTKGFRWEGTGEDPGLICVPGAILDSYQPHPGIFRDFASLEPTLEAVLPFANRYGTLCRRREFNTFVLWRKGIEAMKQLVALSDAVTQSDWRQIPKALEPFLANRSLAGAADLRPIQDKQKRGKIVSRNEWADAAVMRLYHAIAPAHRFMGEGFWNTLSGKVALRIKHADLLGFMHFQLGHALIGGRRFRQCTVCGKWVLLLPGINRKDRTTCSGYCRLKLHRWRAKSQELHRAGWSPRKVARELALDVATVKQWLS
jgi:hypothetical protein